MAAGLVPPTVWCHDSMALADHSWCRLEALFRESRFPSDVADACFAADAFGRFGFAGVLSDCLNPGLVLCSMSMPKISARSSPPKTLPLAGPCVASGIDLP